MSGAIDSLRIIGPDDVAGRLDWPDMVSALDAGHKQARPELGDLLLRDGDRALLTRASWSPGGALGLKSVTIFPDNANRTPPTASIHGAVI